MIKVKFIKLDGQEIILEGAIGQNILQLAHANKDKIFLEGACEGCLACSTCHIIVHPDWYDKLPEPSQEEDEMLDLAYGLQPTSRLGCQVVLTQELDGLTLLLVKSRHDFLNT